MGAFKNAALGAVLASGICFAAGQASALPLTGPAASSPPVENVGRADVEKATYYRHRGWRRGYGGPRIYFGFGGPRWYGGYPRRYWHHRRGW